MNHESFNITAVERETGLAKETLRVWERRYGFPQPGRDAHGERLYPAEQVERLRLIARLIGQGQRPSRLMQHDLAGLAALLAQYEPQSRFNPGDAENALTPASLQPLMTALKQHDIASLHQLLTQQLARQGLQHFVLDTIAPLTEAVGLAWMRGELAVFEEHLYTEQIKRLLRQTISTLPGGQGRPRVVLTTLPGEQHVLGLLMVETLLTLDGACCMALGTQTPLAEIVRATEAHQAEIVALSFSAAFPQRQLAAQLREIRALLPPAIQLWVGGAGVMRLTPPPGITRFCHLPEVLHAFAEWQQNAAML